MDNIDAFGLTGFYDIETGRLFYTWHLGWIDTDHVGTFPSEKEAWKKLIESAVGDLLQIKLVRTNRGISSQRTVTCFCVEVSDDRAGQFYEMFRTHTRRQEENQSRDVALELWGFFVPGERASGLSGEDLVSDMVGGIALVTGIDSSVLLSSHSVGRMPRHEVKFSQHVWRAGLDIGFEGGFVPIYFQGRINPRSTGNTQANFELPRLIEIYERQFGMPEVPDWYKDAKPNPEGVDRIRCESRYHERSWDINVH